MSSSADRPGAVHHREGDACPVCGDTIRAVEYRSYTIDYCPTCQTGGKVLADNTTSKFLK
jgi:formamidopyrimidine-DNA glycosylase